jgi:chromosomal replication initiation ATPase DnaA
MELKSIETKLLDQYNQDFYSKTGKKLEIRVLNRWESLCKLDEKIENDKLFELILEATGWTREDLLLKKNKRDTVLKRKVTSYILHVNGVLFKDITQFVGRDHTSIIHYIKTFEEELDLERYYRRLLTEVIGYINDSVSLNSVTIN